MWYCWKQDRKSPFDIEWKPNKLQALSVLLLLSLASLERYSTAKENVEKGKYNEQECGKNPLPGENKNSICVSSLSNECGACGLYRTDFHQNLQYCN